MKIAVTYENGEIFQHFGHTPQFKIYEFDDGDKVLDVELVDTMSCYMRNWSVRGLQYLWGSWN